MSLYGVICNSAAPNPIHIPIEMIRFDLNAATQRHDGYTTGKLAVFFSPTTALVLIINIKL